MTICRPAHHAKYVSWNREAQRSEAKRREEKRTEGSQGGTEGGDERQVGEDPHRKACALRLRRTFWRRPEPARTDLSLGRHSSAIAAAINRLLFGMLRHSSQRIIRLGTTTGGTWVSGLVVFVLHVHFLP